MAVHHDDAEVLLAGQEALSDAELVVLRLTGECHPGRMPACTNR